MQILYAASPNYSTPIMYGTLNLWFYGVVTVITASIGGIAIFGWHHFGDKFYMRLIIISLVCATATAYWWLFHERTDDAHVNPAGHTVFDWWTTIIVFGYTVIILAVLFMPPGITRQMQLAKRAAQRTNQLLKEIGL